MHRQARTRDTEAKEKHDVWDPMPEFTLTSPYVHHIVDSNTFTMGNPMPEPNLSSSQGLRIWPLCWIREVAWGRRGKDTKNIGPLLLIM
jgi:hypothetical protein